MNTAIIDQLGVLSPAEADDLQAHESTIEAGLQTFVDVGLALAAIRDRRLYRAEFKTFEEYCQEKWGVTARRARQLWAAAGVVRQICLEGNTCSGFLLPATESQARPLTLLPVEQRIPAWEEVLRTAPEGKVTARHVQRVVNGRLGRPASEVTSAAPTVRILEPTPAVRPPIDAGSREEQVEAMLESAIAETRRLVDGIGSADSVVAAEATAALYKLEKIREHFDRIEQRQESRQ